MAASKTLLLSLVEYRFHGQMNSTLRLRVYVPLWTGCLVFADYCRRMVYPANIPRAAWYCSLWRT